MNDEYYIVNHEGGYWEDRFSYDTTVIGKGNAIAFANYKAKTCVCPEENERISVHKAKVNEYFVIEKTELVYSLQANPVTLLWEVYE